MALSAPVDRVPTSVDRVPRDGPPPELLGFTLWGLAMGNLHDLIAARGKKAALEGGVARRDVIEAAAAYLADESDALACAYSGWAQCALAASASASRPTLGKWPQGRWRWL